jgi:sialic acid synthase SpsE
MSGSPREIAIGTKKIGDNHPTYFVADIAANWDGSIERAKELIHLCAKAGANAAKFQNFQAATIVSDYGFKQLAQGGQLSHQAAWKKSVFEVYQNASLPLDWTQELQETCAKAGIDYFTSPYDLDQIATLSRYVKAWKVGSGDITWHAMIERLAADHKPLLIAAGASTMEEVHLAMAVARKHTDQLVLMQCNTNYTASLENFKHIHLNVLKTFAREFPGVVLGLSDHTPGHATVLGAVALGARVIEKHFTDDTTREGPDHKFSMDPASWKEMVDRTRELERALGSEEKFVAGNELETVLVQRRAIRTKAALPKGHVLTAGDLTVLRPIPAEGLSPYKMELLLGKKTTRDIPAGDCVRIEDAA